MKEPDDSEFSDIDEIIREFKRIKIRLKSFRNKLDRNKFLVSSEYKYNLYAYFCHDKASSSFRLHDFEKIFPDQNGNYLPHVKKIKTFPDYLILPSHNGRLKKSQEKLSEICKNLFNTNNSPKDYAVMLCLLSEKGYTLILNKQRVDFYTAWYNFIDRPLPAKNNFCSINKYIDDKAAGFVFKDESDGDYRSMKNAFYNVLSKMNL
jgi:hypothetical protein